MRTNAEQFQSYFTRQTDLIHLNNAGFSPINSEAAAIVRHWLQRFEAEGTFCSQAYLEAVEGARRELALFLDADPACIAFFSSTAAAASQLAFTLGLLPGDEVIMWDQEYASHIVPWQEACRRSGASFISVESAADFGTPVERLVSRVTAATRVIALSWVQFQAGSLTDLAPLVELKKSRDFWLVIDGSQAIGSQEFSFRKFGIDALVSGSHKWMTAPVGAGYLCIDADRASSIKPLTVGAATSLYRDARRFEPGSKQVLEILGLGVSARLLQSFGVKSLLQKSLQLTETLAEGLQDLGYQISQPNGPIAKTPILNIIKSSAGIFDDLEAVSRALQNNKISFVRRSSGLRLSPHAHNSADDIRETLRVFAGKNRLRL